MGETRNSGWALKGTGPADGFKLGNLMLGTDFTMLKPLLFHSLLMGEVNVLHRIDSWIGLFRPGYDGVGGEVAQRFILAGCPEKLKRTIH
jgi:hypothetical protein